MRNTLRLFCFHHAGGGKTAFTGWDRALGPSIAVVPVEVLNRERFGSLEELVQEIDDQLRPALDGPHMFFGHSLGALVAYRLACRHAMSGFLLPRALFLSAYAPPHLQPPLPAIDHLDDHQLAALLSDIGGLPPELDEWPALRDRAVATARTDLQLCMTDDDADAVPLDCPIYALGGIQDPLVSESDLDEWRSRTTGAFSVRMLRGGHFYLSDGAQVLATLRSLLSELTVT
jgi:surfactin synthase thioesterase subunit